MESFKPESEGNKNELSKSEKIAYKIGAPVVAIITAMGIWNTLKDIPSQEEFLQNQLDTEELNFSEFYDSLVDKGIENNFLLLGNVVDQEMFQKNLEIYNEMILSQSSDDISKSLTNSEYLAIHARAVEVAKSKGVKVGEITPIKLIPSGMKTQFTEGPFIVTIDIGEVVEKVVPRVFKKVYVKPGFDTNNGEKELIFSNESEDIIVEDNDSVLTVEEKAIRTSGK